MKAKCSSATLTGEPCPGAGAHCRALLPRALNGPPFGTLPVCLGLCRSNRAFLVRLVRAAINQNGDKVTAGTPWALKKFGSAALGAGRVKGTHALGKKAGGGAAHLCAGGPSLRCCWPLRCCLPAGGPADEPARAVDTMQRNGRPPRRLLHLSNDDHRRRTNDGIPARPSLPFLRSAPLLFPRVSCRTPTRPRGTSASPACAGALKPARPAPRSAWMWRSTRRRNGKAPYWT